MEEQVTNNLLSASKLVSEQFDAYMIDVEGTVQLIAEAVMDRIVGYPDAGWEQDSFVPFFDTESQRMLYPLAQPAPPMEWNITPNINATNVKEHSIAREDWLLASHPVSTANGAYFMQGACNPLEANASSPTYYPTCSEANNDVRTGGAIQPTATNYGLYQKSGDISVFLKALWESQPGVLTMGVFFHNSGAGSQISFPGKPLPGHLPPYTSLGCDWMKNINPFTGDRFATDEEIARCHPNGTLVPQREYNAMERSWFQEFVLNPDNKVGWYGPFDAFDHGTKTMLVGKSIFDRRYVSSFSCGSWTTVGH